MTLAHSPPATGSGSRSRLIIGGCAGWGATPLAFAAGAEPLIQPDLVPDWPVSVLALLLTILVVYPLLYLIVSYRRLGQTQRVNTVIGFFSPEVIADYFLRFWGGNPRFKEAARAFEDRRATPQGASDLSAAGATLEALFKEHVAVVFGQERIASASRFFAVTATIVLYYAILTGLQLVQGASDFPLALRPDLTSLAAIFGAYTWITSDLIYRYRLSDFNSSDIYWYALRLIVAIPLGQVIAAFAPAAAGETGGALAPSSTGPLLAFVVSMFSFTRIQQMLGSIAGRAFNIQTTVADAAEDVVIKLPGIDQNVSDRLAVEGITTVTQLAGSDPILLTYRTNIQFRIILAYVDTAILWRYVGEKVLKLREFGWIGASHIINFAERQDPPAGLAEQYAKAAQERLQAAADLEIARRAAEAADSPTDTATARAELSAKETALNDKREALESALLNLKSQQPPDPQLFEQMATAAGMQQSALPELMKEILSDPQARFVRRLIRAS